MRNKRDVHKQVNNLTGSSFQRNKRDVHKQVNNLTGSSFHVTGITCRD